MDNKFLTSLVLMGFVYLNIGAVDQAAMQVDNNTVELSAQQEKILSMTPEDQEARARAAQAYNDAVAKANQEMADQNDYNQPVSQGCPIAKS